METEKEIKIPDLLKAISHPPYGRKPKCLECKHILKVRGAKCAAFPNGIPDDIYYGNISHDKPYYGDNGIQFEPLDENVLNDL